MESGFEIRSSQLEQAGNAVFSYNNDACAIVVSYANVVALNLQTDEIYYSEYHSASYGKSSDISPDRKHFVVIGGSEVLVFETKDTKLVSLVLR